MSTQTAVVPFAKTPILLDGVTKTVEEWCAEKKIPVSVVQKRRMRADSWKEAFRPLTKRTETTYYKRHVADGAAAITLKKMKMKNKDKEKRCG